jgi:three-Cys-motif partner protein
MAKHNRNIQSNIFDSLGFSIEVKTRRRPKVKVINTEIGFSNEHDMEPHSEAKVMLYGKYLERFLAILNVVQFISKINLFDVFCGTGIYRNGKLGSPIMAYNTIKKVNEQILQNGKVPKPVRLNVNDKNSESISVLRRHIQALESQKKQCAVDFFNLEAKEMFETILRQVSHQQSNERNLIFIDPTGYKDIHKNDIATLLKSNRCEIILFLPISFMYRFTGVAQKDFDNPSYQHLRRFLNDFFDLSHPVKKGTRLDVFAFMKYLKEAFNFNRSYFSTSFYLQRGKNNFYGLFFITPSILGFEKIIEAKWIMDPLNGDGFANESEKSNHQLSLFAAVGFPEIESKKISDLKKLIINEIRNSLPVCDNCDLYELTVMNEFRMTHANKILKELQDDSVIQVWDKDSGKLARKGAFYLKYENFRDKRVKATFTIS